MTAQSLAQTFNASSEAEQLHFLSQTTELLNQSGPDPYHGPSLDLLLETSLQSQNPDIVEKSLNVLYALVRRKDTYGDTILTVAENLARHPDTKIQQRLANALTWLEINSKNTEYTARVISAAPSYLRSPDKDVRAKAIKALLHASGKNVRDETLWAVGIGALAESDPALKEDAIGILNINNGPKKDPEKLDFLFSVAKNAIKDAHNGIAHTGYSALYAILKSPLCQKAQAKEIATLLEIGRNDIYTHDSSNRKNDIDSISRTLAGKFPGVQPARNAGKATFPRLEKNAPCRDYLAAMVTSNEFERYPLLKLAENAFIENPNTADADYILPMIDTLLATQDQYDLGWAASLTETLVHSSVLKDDQKKALREIFEDQLDRTDENNNNWKLSEVLDKFWPERKDEPLVAANSLDGALSAFFTPNVK